MVTDLPDPGNAPLDLRAILDNLVDVVIVHEGGRLVYANAAAAALVGAASPDVLLGRKIVDFVAPESVPSVVARARALTLAGGVTAGNERMFVRLDGSRIPVETTGIALDAGRTLVVIRDRSGEDRVATAHHSAESRLATFSEVALDGIAIARASDGRHVMVNGAHARMFGFARPEDEAGTSVLDLIAPSARPLLAEHMGRFRTGETRSVELLTKGLRRDGTEFDLEVRAASFTEAGGVLIAATLRDVTEAVAAERRLSESERRYRDLFEFVPVSLWEVDASAIRARLDGLRARGLELRSWLASHPDEVAELVRAFKVLSLNAHGCQLAGARTQQEVLDKLDVVEIPEAAARYVELGLQLLEGGTVARAEGWSGTVCGERRLVETLVTALPGHQETWDRLVFASIDVTERRRAEEERALLHERLREAEKLEAVGRLAGGIAHDFNNILSGILGYAELSLLGTEKGSDVHDHQERIREAALRARMLVRQILTFSRRDGASQRVVDVPSVAREALGLMRAGVPATVTLEARIDPDAGATLADPTQIHQIILNLCSNARDAVGPYGRITVEVSRVPLDGEIPGLSAGEYVRLRVADDGAGMDEATKARIFEPYMTTKGPFGGHGLGLPVVHGIVSSAGGRSTSSRRWAAAPRSTSTSRGGSRPSRRRPARSTLRRGAASGSCSWTTSRSS